jgi:tRNA methyl transferase
VKLDGKVVAQHQGLWQYTIGENARIPGQPKRLIVCSKNVETNEIVVVDDPYAFPVFWDVREVTHCMQKSPAIVSFDHSSGILPLDLEPPSTTRGPVRRWATGRSEDQICNAASLGCTAAPVSSFHRTALSLANALDRFNPHSGNNRGTLSMRQPEQGVAEGQIAVFYAASSDWCLGSATIAGGEHLFDAHK